MKIPKKFKNGGIRRLKKLQMKKCGDKVNVLSLLKEYSKNCTLHGVQYVFKDDATVVER